MLLRATAAALLLTPYAVCAQTAAPASPAANPPAAATPSVPAQRAASDLTKSGKPRLKVVRAQCRAEVKGDARHAAMAACIIKQRPDMESRTKCQMNPGLKGMEKDARRAVVQACVAKAKG